MCAWTAACQAPLSMEFRRKEYWNGLPFPTPGDLPDPGIEPRSLALAGGFFTLSHLGSITPAYFNLHSLGSPSKSTNIV